MIVNLIVVKLSYVILLEGINELIIFAVTNHDDLCPYIGSRSLCGTGII